MIFEDTGVYEFLFYYGISVEEKAGFLVCKKKLETFYITQMNKVGDNLYFVEIYHKNSSLNKHKKTTHGNIPDAHLQFRGKLTPKQTAKKIKFHKGEGER